MDFLPEEVVLHIFKLVLDMTDLERLAKKYGRQKDEIPLHFPPLRADKRPLGMLAQVCKRFRRLADNESLWEKVNLLALSEKDLSLFSGSLSTRRTECIRILTINVGSNESDAEEVVEESASWFDDRVVELVHNNWPHLEDLSVWFKAEYLFREDGKGFSNLSFHLPKLKKLLLDGAQKLESLHLASPLLESLWIDGAYKFQRFTFQRNSALPLKRVRLTDTFLSAAKLRTFLAQVGHSITSLDLGTSSVARYALDEMVAEDYLQKEEFIPVTRQTLELVAEYLPNLEQLSLSGDSEVPLYFQLTDLPLLAKACPKLSKLQIEDNIASASMVVKSFSIEDICRYTRDKISFPMLTSIHLKLLNPKARILEELPQWCPSLQELHLELP